MARCDDWSSCMIALVMLHKVHKAWHEKVIFSTGSPVFGVVIDQDSRNKSQNGAVLLLTGRIVRPYRKGKGNLRHVRGKKIDSFFGVFIFNKYIFCD
jgi:hypothetical protein